MIFSATLTTDSNLLAGVRRNLSRNKIVGYLNSSPRHAVVLHSLQDQERGEIKFDPELYVLRGASESLDNFYWGPMPAEDPGDAEGGDLTAAEALQDAVSEYV